MTTPLSAVAAGHLCLDIFPNFENMPVGQFDSLFKPGRLLKVGAAQFSTGGPVSNTGLALHRLGVPTRLVARVGADPFGQIVRDLVMHAGAHLAEGITIDPHAATSYSVIISPPGLDRIFLHCTGANDTFTSQDIPYDLVGGSALFHFGYPPIMRQMYINEGRELVEILRRVKAAGVTTSLDMAFPDPASESGRADWRAILKEALPYADIFLPSVEELLFVLRRAEFEKLTANGDLLQQVTPSLLHDLSDEILEMGVRIVVLKLGSRGAYLRTGTPSALQGMGKARPTDWQAWAEREMWAPCFRVDVVGTTGSGDATIAGFLGALLRGMPPEGALTMAVAVGACNVEAADALSGLKSWQETEERIQKGWARLPLSLEEAGWHFDPQAMLWLGKA